MSGQLHNQPIRVFTLVVVIVLGIVNTSEAVEIGFKAENMVTVSDNINRDSSGLEKSGSKLLLRGDLDLSGRLGSSTVGLGIGGGWESVDNGGTTNTDNFSFNLNVNTPWTPTGYLEGSATIVDETAEPEITDIKQQRVRTRTSTISLGIGKQATPTFGWKAGLSNRTESRIDLDLDESRTELSGDFKLGRKRRLVVDTGFTKGTEDLDGESWTGSTVSLDINIQSVRFTSRGYGIAWENLKLEQEDGTQDSSDKITAKTYFVMQISPEWSATSDLGLDSIRPSSEKRRFEPHVQLGLSGRLNPRLGLEGRISSSALLQDPDDDQVAWTRDSQLQAWFVWNASKTYTVEPGVQFRNAKYFGNEIADSSAETRVLKIETRWIPIRNWTIGLNAQTETRNATQKVYDFSEDRLELSLSGILF